MSIESTQATIEIARLSELINQKDLPDSDLEKAISDLDAIESPEHKAQAFFLRWAASQKLSDPDNKTANMWKSLEYGKKLAQTNQDPDLVLLLRDYVKKIQTDSTNSQEKILQLSSRQN